MQKATVPEMESRVRQKEGKDTFDTVKIKLNRIKREMESFWDVLEDSQNQLEVTLRKKQELKTEMAGMEYMKSDSEKQKQDTDVSMKITQWVTELKGNMQRQTQAIENMFAQVQSERDEIEIIKTKIQREKENIERDRQLAKVEMDAMKCMRESTERKKWELDSKLEMTMKEMREMEVMRTEIEIKKKDLVKMIRMNRRQKEEISKIKEEVEHAKQDMKERQDETKGQKSKQVLEVNIEGRFDEQKIRLQQVDSTREIIQHTENQLEEDSMETKNKLNSDMQRVILEIKEIRNMLHSVGRDTEQIRRDFTEEKNQIKWMTFQAKKMRQKLDQQLEKTRKERHELEIMKIKIQREREEFEQKLKDTTTTILTMGEIKANIEKAAVEMNNTREEMIQAQGKMEKNKEEVKTYTLR
ncbi:myosin-6-like [Micropterus dolomieu]|uniref:myosin-6-like n=1 Tax=Micropterus dolomieu TaxID=147949 RepID=UPI001E8CA39B|nr:myosin-6-like [Micropterus dolomieu]